MEKEKEILMEKDVFEDREAVDLDDAEVEDLLDSFEVPATEEGLSAYLKRISSYPVLSREEEIELARRARAGDKEAFRKLVESNLRFVVSVASKYKGYGVPLMDLINEGNLGLIQAAKRFDPDRGVRFISYAVWWIKQAIMQALAEQSGVVKLPLKQASVLLKIRNTYEELLQRLGREPTTEEIAAELDMEPEDVEDILRVARIHLSLEAPINKDEEDTTFLDLMEATTPSAEEEAIKSALAEHIEEMLSQLKPREACIIRCRFGMGVDHPMTLEEIGKILGVSRERVRQIEARALQKLKKLATAKKLEDYLN